MATATEIHDSLESFADSFNSHAKLPQMYKEWNRVIDIFATDINEHFALVCQDGNVICEAAQPLTCDLLLQAHSDIIAEVFYGELSPNDPYNDGRLRIQGSEADVLQLDFVTAMLWE